MSVPLKKMKDEKQVKADKLDLRGVCQITVFPLFTVISIIYSVKKNKLHANLKISNLKIALFVNFHSSFL